MTRPRSEATPLEPAVLSAHDLAELFNHGETWLWERLDRLEAAGLPAKDELLDGWNRYQVLAWFQGRTEATGEHGTDDLTTRLQEFRGNGQG